MLKALWPERYEAFEREYNIRSGLLGMPSVSDIDRDVAKVQAKVATGHNWMADVFLNITRKHMIGDYVPTPHPDRFDPLNPFDFQAIPIVMRYLLQVQATSYKLGLNPDFESHQAFHILYHLYHFKKNSQRVYVIDKNLYELLRDTELPKWNFEDLNFPLPCFYIKFPEDVFYFDVQVDPKPQMVEGVFVTINGPKAIPDQSRDLTILVTGISKVGPWDDNIVYGGIGIGPHAKLTDVRFEPLSDMFNVGGEKLDKEVPHVVLSLMLYLNSEHPDIVPVDPPKRPNMKNIRSPKIRENTIRNFEKKMKGKSRFGYLLVGSHLKSLDEQAKDYEKATGRKLEKGHRVSGHWKNQPYGPKRMYRKTIWVEPYWRGPDFAERIEIRAAKVQTGQKRK